MIILVVGGAKSGKSDYAEKIAQMLHEGGNLYYIATMNPHDEEDQQRIKIHQQKREGRAFQTLEAKRQLHKIIDTINPHDTILLDSLTSWMTNEMFVMAEFYPNVSVQMLEVVKKINTKHLVIVSDYLFSDAIHYDAYTETFRRELGYVNCEIAKLADVVIECVYGNTIVHKGKEALHEKLILRT